MSAAIFLHWLFACDVAYYLAGFLANYLAKNGELFGNFLFVTSNGGIDRAWPVRERRPFGRLVQSTIFLLAFHKVLKDCNRISFLLRK